jgi:hypothetical protein
METQKKIKLDLTTINIYELIDQPTLASYMADGADAILKQNRPYYENSQEICVNGIYFALTEFTEADTEFRVLAHYKKSPRSKKTYRYAFGAYNPDKNELVWFFNAQPYAESRLVAVKTYAALKQWCDANHPNLLPFAYKK